MCTQLATTFRPWRPSSGGHSQAKHTNFHNIPGFIWSTVIAVIALDSLGTLQGTLDTKFSHTLVYNHHMLFGHITLLISKDMQVVSIHDVWGNNVTPMAIRSLMTSMITKSDWRKQAATALMQHLFHSFWIWLTRIFMFNKAVIYTCVLFVLHQCLSYFWGLGYC